MDVHAARFILAPLADSWATQPPASRISLANAFGYPPVTVEPGFGLSDRSIVSWPGVGRVDPSETPAAGLLWQAYLGILSGDTGLALKALEQMLARGGACLPEAAEILWPDLNAAGNAPVPSQWGAGAPVAIRTLGSFEIRVHGELLDRGRKQPRRVLTMLKAIIALGGREVRAASVADLLWPDLDGDKAHDAFQVTLHRLRARLQAPGAITCRGGLVSLSPEVVWVDALSLEACCLAQRGGAFEHALELYRGEFLPDEVGTHWTARPRERLRARFREVVATAAAALEAEQPREALTLYQRAIDVDELASVFHDGLIRCLSALGRVSEVEGARRRQRRVREATRAQPCEFAEL